MNTDKSNQGIYDITIRLFIVIFIVAWCLMIMYPFLNIMLWSIVLAMAIFPLHKSVAKKLGAKFASILIIFSFIVIVILPSGLLINQLFQEVKELKVSYESGTLVIPPPAEKVKDWPVVGDKIYSIWLASSENLEQTVVKYQDQLLDLGKKLLAGIANAISGIGQIIISLFIAGILLVVGGVGESIRKFFRKLAGDRGDEFADITLQTVASVVKGILGVAFLLALLHGLIFLLAGVPYAGIWAFLVFILAILQIPVIFITLPIIIYLFASHNLNAAIIWTIVLVIAGLSDNVLKPILLGKGAAVPMLVIFIGVIGGFIFSGFIGMFTGAIILSIGYKLFVGWINTDTEIKA